MTKNAEIENLCDHIHSQIRDLDRRLDGLVDQLRGGSDGQAGMLRGMIEKTRGNMATLRLAVREAADASATEAQKKDVMLTHGATVASYESQSDWYESAVTSWRQQRESHGPDWRAELDKIREQCDTVEGKCDEIAAAVRPRGLRDSNGTAIANYAAQALDELFKLRVHMLEFAESQAVNSIQEIERSLRIFNSDLRQQQDHVDGFLKNRLSEWRRASQS